MVDPTESEDLTDLDSVFLALVSIRNEIDAVVDGQWDRLDNPLKPALHTQEVCMGETWDRPCSRQTGCMPAA